MCSHTGVNVSSYLYVSSYYYTKCKKASGQLLQKNNYCSSYMLILIWMFSFCCICVVILTYVSSNYYTKWKELAGNYCSSSNLAPLVFMRQEVCVCVWERERVSECERERACVSVCCQDRQTEMHTGRQTGREGGREGGRERECLCACVLLCNSKHRYYIDVSAIS
jgi:hypothetical protein